MRLPSRQDGESEVKFRDPNGVVFDIVVDEYATKSWGDRSDQGVNGSGTATAASPAHPSRRPLRGLLWVRRVM